MQEVRVENAIACAAERILSRCQGLFQGTFEIRHETATSHLVSNGRRHFENQNWFLGYKLTKRKLTPTNQYTKYDLLFSIHGFLNRPKGGQTPVWKATVFDTNILQIVQEEMESTAFHKLQVVAHVRYSQPRFNILLVPREGEYR